MSKMMATILVILIIALFTPIPVGSYSKRLYSEEALQHIAWILGVPIEQLEIVNEISTFLPTIEQTIHSLKILDAESHKIYRVFMDENGNVIDVENVKLREKTAYFAKYGKLELDLFQRLQEISAEEMTKVAVWLKTFDTSEENIREVESEDEYIAKVSLKKSLIASKQKPIIDFLNANGLGVLYASRYAPLIITELPKWMIEKLQERTEVDMIYVARTFELQLDVAAKTIRANLAWNLGINGSGVKIGVVEAGAIQFQNPYLADGTYFNPNFNPNDTRDNEHATAVAGIIASTHETYRGIAYGAPALLSANAGSNNEYDKIVNATEWALNNSAKIINLSFGVPASQQQSIDVYFDYIVWNYGITVVAAAGNWGTSHGLVIHPGMAYNVITVGGIDNKRTENWLDDIMWPDSSWNESTTTDREKPEVVAVSGGYYDMLLYSTNTSYPWIEFFSPGTSFAAPAIAGTAALLMEENTELRGYPEVVKAIIMASAVHNIEGDRRLSEYDGAGCVDASAALEMAMEGQFKNLTLHETDFPWNYTFAASAGERVRVSIAWNTHANETYPSMFDPLESDLDLTAYNSTGLIQSSTSFNNNFEIVDFIANETGNYTATITSCKFNSTYENVGFAYYKKLSSDVNGDRTVDIFDVCTIGIAFGAEYNSNDGMYWHKPPYGPCYYCPHSPIADVDGNGIVDIFDLVAVAIHFGESSQLEGSSFGQNSSGSGEMQMLLGDPASISLYPNQVIVHKGETFSANIAVNNVADLYGWELKLYWNNAVLRCTNAQIYVPTEWSEDNTQAGAGIQNTFNTTYGRYWKALAALSPAPAFNGSMTIATLTFEAKAAGTTMLDFQETKLCDTQANAIQHSASDGSVTVLSLPRFMRGDTQTVNGLTAYQLGTVQSSIQKSYSQIRSGYLSASWGIRVWKRNVNGSEIGISSGIVAQVARTDEGEGLQSATWTCPQTSLDPTDSLVVRVYQKIGSGSWQLAATFTTEQLNSTQLVGTTWAITYYTRLYWTEEPPLKTSASFCWGTTTYNSRIENLNYI